MIDDDPGLLVSAWLIKSAFLIIIFPNESMMILVCWSWLGSAQLRPGHGRVSLGCGRLPT